MFKLCFQKQCAWGVIQSQWVMKFCAKHLFLFYWILFSTGLDVKDAEHELDEFKRQPWGITPERKAKEQKRRGWHTRDLNRRILSCSMFVLNDTTFFLFSFSFLCTWYHFCIWLSLLTTPWSLHKLQNHSISCNTLLQIYTPCVPLILTYISLR